MIGGVGLKVFARRPLTTETIKPSSPSLKSDFGSGNSEVPLPNRREPRK